MLAVVGENQHSGVDDRTLLQGSSKRTVQAVFEVELAPPFHDMGEQIPVERGVVSQQRVQL